MRQQELQTNLVTDEKSIRRKYAIYNVGWSQFFSHFDLKAGREYACNGKVLDIKQDSKAITATVKGSKNYKVTFAIHNNNEINKMNCTCLSFESKRYCKHCAAVLWKLDPLSEKECAQNNLLDQGGSIKCTLPKSASPKEKLEDIVRQLKSKYKNKKIYSLWIIERENSEFKSSTINAWSRAATGLSLSEYLLSIGVLSPMVNFEMTEDDVDLADIKGKRCCSVSVSGGTDIWIDELLKKLGAKVVFPTDSDIDYAVIRNFNITKEPEDNNRHAFWLMSLKESGNAKFGLLGDNFINKARNYVAAMEIEQASANDSNQEQLPRVGSFKDLMYFPESEKDQNITVEIGGKNVQVINNITYEAKKYELSSIPKLVSDKSYASVKKLSAKIKDLLGLDYSAILIGRNYKDLETVDTQTAKEDIERFSRVCMLCKSPAVLKLISYAVKRNKDGSLTQNAVTPIIQTRYIPLDLNQDQFWSVGEFLYYELIANSTDKEIILRVRRKEIVNNFEEDIYKTAEVSQVSEELIAKILQIGDLIDGNDTQKPTSHTSEVSSAVKSDDIKAQNLNNNNRNDFEKTKSVCDTLRDKLIRELRSEDYTYPETDGSFSVSGIFIKELNFDILSDICKHYFSTKSTDYDGNWSVGELYRFLEKELNRYHKGERYSISISFGGLPPAVVILSFLEFCSKITELEVRFTHNKWESRGDITYKEHVGILLRNGGFEVGTFGNNEHGVGERWDYVPDNFTVAGQPLRLLSYNESQEESDVLVLPRAIHILQKEVFRGCKFKNIYFDTHTYDIELGVFSDCAFLESIDWPNTVYIRENMFKNCTNLTSVTIPEGVYGIEKGAFAGCKNLEEINIPSTVAFIEDGAFDGCDALVAKNPEVWNSISSINKSKENFLACIEAYKQYIVNNGYESFEDIYYGFQYIIDTMNACKLWHKLYDSYIGNLDKLNVGNYKYVLYATKNQLAKIETNYNAKIAELGWKKTRDVSDTTDYLIVDTEDIPRFTTFIAKQHRLSEGDEQGASKFGTTPMEKAIELIDSGRSIKIITLKNFCELLNTDAVSKEVFISRSDSLNSSNVKITKEGKEVPKSIKQESKANIEGSIPISENFVVFRGILKQYNGKDSEVVIPETVTKIGERAFKDNKKLKAVALHDGIVRIDGGAFWGCTSLQSIVIPDGVSKIDWGTFNECSALKEVTIGKGVTNIGERAFRNCKALKNLFVSDTVTYFGVSAFDGCGSLTISGYADSKAEKYAIANEIKFKRIVVEDKPESKAEVTVSNPEMDREEELRKIREDNEQRARENQERQTRIEAEERKKREEEDALRKAKEVEQDKAFEAAYLNSQEDAERRKREVKIKASSTSKLSSASLDDFKMQRNEILGYKGRAGNVTLPPKYTKVAEKAFANNDRIIILEIPSGYKKIEKKAFDNCSKLREVRVAPGVQIIDDYAFSNCVALESIEISEGISELSDCLFYNCKKLKGFIIPQTVDKITASVFANCESLQEICIPYGVTSIGMYAFASCAGLRDVYIPSTVKMIGKKAFMDCNKFTLHVEKGSRAEKYAIENNYFYDYDINNKIMMKSKAEYQTRLEEESVRKAQEEEAEHKAREEAERKAQEEAERKAQEEAERKVREEAERQACEEAERKKREEIERIIREAEERRLRAEAERKAQEEAEHKAREEERKARAEAERKAQEEERKAREEAERKAREEEERKAREEAEIKAREEVERLEQERIRAERQAKKLCQHCGGTFKGLFTKKCSNCGMKKDY